jgi:hypothetical protein
VTEQRFQDFIRYGGIALGLCVVLNIWAVMRHFEVYHDAARVDRQAQEMVLREQVLQGVVKDFAAQANNDSHITEILNKMQTTGAPTPPWLSHQSP